jgi:MioC protein
METPALHLVVLVGSTKGRAEAVAAEVAADLAEAGTTVAVVSMEHADEAVVAGADALVVCTSTFGAGGVPVNAQDFLERLEAGAIRCAGIPVGYIGLGDRSFRDTYNGGWRTMARAFSARGAVAVGEPLLFDAADALPPADAVRLRRERIAAWTATFRILLAAAG